MSRNLNSEKHLQCVLRLPCPKCDNITRHQVLACIDDCEGGDEEPRYWLEYEIVACLGCEEISFRKNWQSTDDLGYDEDGNYTTVDHPVIFPPRKSGRKHLKRDYELPPKILAIYHEVHQALANDLRVLAGIGIRALVEAVCSEKGTKEGGCKLKESIDGLATKNILTPEAAQVLHGIRFLGNNAAHETTAPKEVELEAAIDIAEQLLMNVYILPKIGEELNIPVRVTHISGTAASASVTALETTVPMTSNRPGGPLGMERKLGELTS
ncbi:MAG: DUF4145 domain-containing protein [Planctomycetota bacterium]